MKRNHFQTKFSIINNYLQRRGELEEVPNYEINTVLDPINFGIVNSQFKSFRINVNGNNITAHSSKLNGIATNPSKAIDNNRIGFGSGSDTPQCVSNRNLFGRDGIPSFLVHFDTFIVFGEKIVPLKPILLNNWTHVLCCFFPSPNNMFPFLMSFNWNGILK